MESLGYISIGVLGFTGLCLVLGIILGIIRGAKRSVLRFVIVLACALAAFLLRNTFVETVKGIEIQGKTITMLIEEALASGAEQESIKNLVTALVNIIISLGCYFVIFFGLQLVTWMIIFPLFKLIFFGSDRKLKDSGIRVRQHRFIGMIIGLIQGALVAFVVLAPLNGLLVKTYDLSKVEVNGQQAVKIPENVGLDKYVESPYCKIYSAAGNWYFEMLSTGTYQNSANEQKAISLSAAVDVVVTGSKFAAEVTLITEKMNEVSTNGEITVEIANQVKDSLKEMDALVENLSDSATELIDGLIKDLAQVVSGSDVQDIAEYLPEDFSFSDVDFGSIGDAIVVIAEVNTEESKTINSENAKVIVDAFINNEVIVNVIGDNFDGGLVNVTETEEAEIRNAINTSEITAEQKAKLLSVLLGE